MQILELDKMHLVPLPELELQDIDGGTWPSWVKAFPIAWLADQIIRNWDDIKDGLKEGYKAQV
jgi:hypothetical protein